MIYVSNTMPHEKGFEDRNRTSECLSSEEAAEAVHGLSLRYPGEDIILSSGDSDDFFLMEEVTGCSMISTFTGDYTREEPTTLSINSDGTFTEQFEWYQPGSVPFDTPISVEGPIYGELVLGENYVELALEEMASLPVFGSIQVEDYSEEKIIRFECDSSIYEFSECAHGAQQVNYLTQRHVYGGVSTRSKDSTYVSANQDFPYPDYLLVTGQVYHG